MEISADYSSGPAAATGRDVRPHSGRALTVLGLETSCDETAASVVRLTPSAAGGRAEVLSSVVHSQIDDHAAYGGVVPEIAARSHVEMIAEVTRRAMAEAGMGYDGLDGIAATAGPGLVGGVLVGLSFGTAAALARGLHARSDFAVVHRVFLEHMDAPPQQVLGQLAAGAAGGA